MRSKPGEATRPASSFLTVCQMCRGTLPKAEVLRLARERIEAEAGRKVPDRELERLIDEVIATNERAG